MVKLSDLSPESARHLLDKECPEFETAPFVAGPPLRERRVAIVTTAGLHRRNDKKFDVSEFSGGYFGQVSNIRVCPWNR